MDHDTGIDDDDVYNDNHAYGVQERGDHNEWQQGGISTKVPPLFDGKTSWFQYEELVDDWVDLTTLQDDKHGPALKNRLVGEAAVYKSLLDRDILKTNLGVQHFKAILRPNFVKGAQSVFLWRFFQLIRSHRGPMEFVKWIGKFTVMQKRVLDAWMDLQPQYTKQSSAYLEDVYTQNTINQANDQGQNLDPNDDSVFLAWRTRAATRHKERFPLGENLFALVFVIVSDLSEAQRERLQSTLSLRGLRVEEYEFKVIR